MFLKPFRTKASVTVRNSDRRKVKSRLSNFYPEFTDDILSQMVPAKGDFKESKVVTHKGEPVVVYTFEGEPTVLEMKNGTLIPYLYSLWSIDDVQVPTLHTTPDVLSRFVGGADLMAPGIVPTPNGLCQHIEKHKAVCVKIAGQKHHVAVGVAEQSSDQLMRGLSGKAVRIVSCIGDTLWATGSKKVPPTEIDPEFKNRLEDIEILKLEDCEETQTDEEKTGNETEEVLNEVTENVDSEEGVEKPEERPIEEIRAEHDSLLEKSFKVAIKGKLANDRERALPLLCSTFFSQYLLPSVPAGCELKIKKTSHKKLSTYFTLLEHEGVLKVEKVSNGVDQIKSVDFKNSFFRGWQDNVDKNDENESTVAKPMVQVLGASSTKDDYAAPAVQQLYVVQGSVESVFTEVGCRRGTVLNHQDIRRFVTAYIDLNNLRGRKDVLLDPTLHKAVYGKGNEDKETASWDKIFGGIQSKMGAAYSVQFPGQSNPVVKKGKMPRMDVTTKKVSGNKMVSLITGFECFFLDPNLFADKLKKLAQASASIGPDISGKFTQVLIQGNQIKHIEKILTIDFNIEKKFLYGLDAGKGQGKKGKK